MTGERLILPATALALMCCSSVLADDSPGHPLCKADEPAKVAVYQGLDDRGNLVRLTIADIKVETFQRLPDPTARARPPDPDWTARIGAGTASAYER
jgi:hypothetical protein